MRESTEEQADTQCCGGTRQRKITKEQIMITLEKKQPEIMSMEKGNSKVKQKQKNQD